MSTGSVSAAVEGNGISYAHVGYVHQCLHKREPCTFFNISMATDVTARDARVTS